MHELPSEKEDNLIPIPVCANNKECNNMRHLIAGVSIFEQFADQSISPRYWLNSGTIKAPDYPATLHNYDPAASVPLPDWRVATPEEMQILATDQPGSTGDWISILKLPSEFLTPFRMLHEASKGDDVEPLRQAAGAGHFTPEIKQIEEKLQPLSTNPEQALEGGFIFVGFPGKLTLTYARGPRYIGLHIDSFYQVSPQERAKSPNRICMNLGAGDRYLYYINIPVIEMIRLLQQSGSSDPRQFQGGSHLGTAFMEHFPHYPVIKLRIAPGEAYIAPTENIIHDGSSLDNAFFDVHLTFRGSFKPHW